MFLTTSRASCDLKTETLFLLSSVRLRACVWFLCGEKKVSSDFTPQWQQSSSACSSFLTSGAPFCLKKHLSASPNHNAHIAECQTVSYLLITGYTIARKCPPRLIVTFGLVSLAVLSFTRCESTLSPLSAAFSLLFTVWWIRAICGKLHVSCYSEGTCGGINRKSFQTFEATL